MRLNIEKTDELANGVQFVVKIWKAISFKILILLYNCRIHRLTKSLEKPDLLKMEVYFLWRKEMSAVWSLGRLEWMMTDILEILLLFYGTSLSGFPNNLRIV